MSQFQNLQSHNYEFLQILQPDKKFINDDIFKDGDVNLSFVNLLYLTNFLVQTQGECNALKIANVYAFFFPHKLGKYMTKLERTMFDSKTVHTYIGKH